MLSERQIKILFDFYGSPTEIIQLKNIAEKHNVSIRTVQNDIVQIRQALNDSGMVLQSFQSKGCQLIIKNQILSNSYMSELLQKNNLNLTFSEQSQRVRYLLKKLIESKTYISAEQLAGDMYISRSRLNSDFHILKNTIAPYKLLLETRKNYGVRIVGDEIDKRQCIIRENLVFDYSPNIQMYSDNYPMLSTIRTIVTNTLIDEKFLISDIALQNLILHVAVAVRMVEGGRGLTKYQYKLDPSFHHSLHIASIILERCSSTFHVQFSEPEIHLLAVNLYGKRDYGADQFITEKINDAIYTGLKKIKENYNIDLTNDLNLRIALGLHLMPLISRIKMHMLVTNVMTYTIKQEYMLAFEIASFFSSIVLNSYCSNIGDDELSYLALHFSVSIQSFSEKKKNNDVLIISRQKRSDTILLQQQIKQHFPSINKIDVQPAYFFRDKSNFQKYNSVLTTEPDLLKMYSNITYVNYFLNDEDYKRIALSLTGFDLDLDLLQKFNPDLFWTGQCADKDEVIEQLVKLAENKGLADESLHQSILRHEKIASSYFGNKLAIPHPEELLSDSTFIAVAILNHDIIWEDNYTANVIFLVCIEKNNPVALRLWNHLSFLISNVKAIESIHDIPTYEHMQKVIKSVYSQLF